MKHLRNLATRERPQLAMIGLVITLLSAVWVSLDTHDVYASWPKGETVSVIGLFLPTAFFDEIDVLFAAELALWLCAILVVTRRGLPWSSWFCLGAYLVMSSWFWENLPWFRHKYAPIFWILLGFCIWIQIERHRLRDRRFFALRCAPRWVGEFAVLSLASFYTFSGLSKLLRSGLAWGDGVSLQLWTRTLGDADSLLFTPIVESRAFAAFLQSGTLVVETLCVVAVFSRRARVAIGLSLLALHISVDLSFHIPFRSNIALILWFFVFEPIVRSRREKNET